MEEGKFDFKKFSDELKIILFFPNAFFPIMPKEGGFVEPNIKAVLFGLAGGIISFIWNLLGLSGFGAAVGIAAIILTPIYALIGLFIGGVILLIISAICSGNTNYEANVRATASLMVLLPINSLFAFTYGISLYLGSTISLLLTIYGIWLLYNALVHALSAKQSIAKVISIIIAIIPVLAILSSLVCYKATTTVSDKIMEESENFMKELPTNDEEAKETQEKIKKMVDELIKKSK